MSLVDELRTLGDLEALAAQRTPADVWAYVQGGGEEERSVRRNHRALERWSLVPRLGEDVTQIDLRTRILDREVRAPFFPSALAYQGLLHPDGELATARAAAHAGLLAMFSTLSTRSLEEIAASAPGPRWFQLYLQPEWEASRALIARAERAGYAAIVLTADVPVLAVRDRQVHGGGIAIDQSPPLGNGPAVVSPGRRPGFDGQCYRFRGEPATIWAALDRITTATTLPVVVKGVLSADDARQAVEHGARGVIVSNHGGRQLDLTPAPLDVLPEVVAAVGPDAEVYVDGGFRRGSDLLVALALGARAVGVGRPLAWALAVGGEAGVTRWIELLATELVMDLALVGRRSVSEVDARAVRPALDPEATAGTAERRSASAARTLAGATARKI